MPDRDDLAWAISTAITPPAAYGLPPAALDSATAGADRIDAAALTLQGRNVLAHALVQLARDGWLRREPDPTAAWDVSDREHAQPQAQPAPTTPGLATPAREWVVAAAKPWGAGLSDLADAMTDAAHAYRQHHGLPEGTDLPDAALRVHTRGDQIVITTEEPTR